jgi:hypothetical protein
VVSPGGAPHAFRPGKIGNATMEIQSRLTGVHGGFVRRRCRNRRCGAKLRQETGNPRDAFCCRGCFELHYRKFCVVCERPLRRKPERKAGRPTQFCRPKCKGEFRRHSARLGGKWGAPLPTLRGAARNTPRSARKSGLKTRADARLTWRLVAGPDADLDPVNLAVPLDPDIAARVCRANERAWLETRRSPRRPGR